MTRRASGGGRGEAGVTLIELLVTITIMGIVFTVFVGGIGLAIQGSDTHRRVVTAETVLRNAVEELQRLPYENCATPLYDVAPDDPADLPADVGAPTATFKGYLINPADTQFADPASCSGPDGGAQLIEVAVGSSPTSSRAVRSQSVQVVKRR